MGEETGLVRETLEYLALLGIIAWRNNTGRRGGVSYGSIGKPDIIGILWGGRFLGIEVKTSTGKTSDEQAEFIRDASAAGALVFVARSVQDVRKVFVNEGVIAA